MSDSIFLSETAARCPLCGAAVSRRDETCAECGEPLTGRALSAGVWRDGKVLVLARDAELPDRCIKSNEPAETRLKFDLSWHHPAIYVAVVISPLIYIVLALVLRHQAKIEVGLTQEWRDRRRTRILICWLMAGACIATMIGGLAAGNDPGYLAFFMGLIGLLVALLLAASWVKLFTCQRISKEYVWLTGIHPEYLATLPEFPGEAA